MNWPTANAWGDGMDFHGGIMVGSGDVDDSLRFRIPIVSYGPELFWLDLCLYPDADAESIQQAYEQAKLIAARLSNTLAELSSLRAEHTAVLQMSSVIVPFLEASIALAKAIDQVELLSRENKDDPS